MIAKIETAGSSTKSRASRASSLMLLLAFAPINVAYGEIHPERVFATAREKLQLIRKQIESTSHLRKSPGLGLATAAVDRSFLEAEQFFAQGEYLACTQALNQYLDQTQVPEVIRYARAQLLLGHSYEELGYSSRAIRAYRRFLSTFLTLDGRNYNELIEVLKRLMPLVAKLAARMQAPDLEALLSAVVNLDLPKERMAEARFYAALAASKSGKEKIAEEWLEDARSLSKDIHLQARSLLSLATISILRGDYAAGKEVLARVMLLNGPEAAPLRSTALLALARLAVHTNENKEALRYYKAVSSDGPEYRESLFERVYVLVDLGMFQEAYETSTEFLNSYPQHADSVSVRAIQSYLKLHSGNLTDADQDLMKSNQNLAALAADLRVRFGLKPQLNWQDLIDFRLLTYQNLTPSPVLTSGEHLFHHVAELRERLAALQGSIRNLFYGLSRLTPRYYQPALTMRHDQIAEFVKDIFEIGDQLIQTEQVLYENELSKVDDLRLQGLRSRRAHHQSPVALAKLSNSQWAVQSYFMNLKNNLSQTLEVLKRARADHAATKYLSAMKPSQSRSALTLQRQEGRISKLEATFVKTLGLLHRSQLQHLDQQLPITLLKRNVISVATLLYQESAILATYRDRSDQMIWRKLGQDAELAWKDWEYSVQLAFERVSFEKSHGTDQIRETMAQIERLLATESKLKADLDRIEGVLSLQMGESVGELLDHYNSDIAQRLSRNKKWRADIEWLRYRDISVKKRAVNEEFELEQQTIKNNLDALPRDGEFK